MPTMTAKKNTAENLDLVSIEERSGRFVPPAEAMLPDELHPARQRVLITRAAWLKALNAKRVADRVQAGAKAAHKAAVDTAALNGEDVRAVVDERPKKLHDQIAATEAAAAALRAVETRWTELVDGIAAHRTAIVDGITPDVEAAQATLLDLETRAAEQRRVTQRLQAQRDWLAGVARSNQNRSTTQNGAVFT